MTEPTPDAISSHVFPTRPRLRAGFSVVPGEHETVVYSPRLRSADSIEDPDGVWAALLGACDGSASVEEVRARVLREGFDLAPADVDEGITALVESGLVVDAVGDVHDD